MAIVSSGQITITDLSDGKDGVGISNTIIEYVGAASGTSKPTSGWSATIPTVPAGQYLWTRTTWQYTDGTSEQGFTKALMGLTGVSGKDGLAGKDGVGIKSTVITYAISISGTTAPSTGWKSSVPSLVKGQYLWTKTVWSYTDNSSETGYSVSYNSKDGADGTNGTSGIIVSSVAPATPQNGQLWQDTSTTPQLVKKWTGSSWVIWKM